MSAPVLLEAEGVRACYGAREIIRSVGLRLREGELVALLGLNGSGKTTLLRSLCGLHRISGGCCRVRGTDCASLREKARAQLICYLPQHSGVVYPIPAEEVALMGRNPHLPLFGMPGKKDRERAHAIFEQLGIPHLWGIDFLHLSEGQKQLVILARAIVQDAPVMLLDEPDSALDFVNRHLVFTRIRAAVQGGGRCGLVTLHDPNFALAYCDRLLLLQDGGICEEVETAQAGCAELRAALSRLYGEIDILEHPGGYFVVKRSASP